MDLKITHAYVTWTNTDLTEGRGKSIPLAICENEATAMRLGARQYVMGTDCPIECVEIVRWSNGRWYGPVHIIASTNEDDKRQAIIDAHRIAKEKAKLAGLTDDDIKALGGK